MLILDKEKKKYFKIQQQGPATSSYSSHDIKRRKIEDEDIARELNVVAQQKNRIVKAFPSGSLAGAILSRAHHGGRLDVIAQVYAYV